ncbi:MAG: AMP-binding protein, partial [Candidatus Thermoplasmatota archaeon]
MTTSLGHIPDRFNAASFFVDRNIAEGRGDKIAFFHEDRTVTYRQLQEMVNRVGNALLDLGVEMEQRVLLILMDCPEFVASFFGAIKIGAVPVPANTMMRAEDYLYFLNDSRARAAIIAEPLLAEVGRILGRAKHLKHVVVLGRAEGAHIAFDEWVADASTTLTAADTSKDDVAFWLYSSGSTGFPKGVVHLQHDMVVCSDMYALQVLGITERDRT